MGLSMSRRTLLAAALLALIGYAPPRALAQSDGQELGKTVDETVDIHAGSQRQQDDWATERAELTNRYRNLVSSVDYLEEKRALLAEKAAGLEGHIGELERSIDESARLQESLQDTLAVIMGRLEAAVDADLPFLAAERQQRLDALRKELARPEVSGAEKLRRLLETLQIEAEYGSNVEVYQAPITVAGEEIYADLLRVGRVSVFWRTPDGKRVGEYDPAARQWVELPGSDRRNIATAMEMAARMRPVELVDLPLGRIEP
ncbi:MAG: DUF3450 domain-containing protein [Candidatus Latescibacteria bacterium]|nr:DUF3450 domain-containing protein [Candidatus Latescibacterota bacterium]